jgi:FMN reductase [NAD(P)H]
MEFTEVLRQRRMVRHYRPDPVPDDTLRRIVQVVRRAPSAGFSQGHRIVVVTDPTTRQGFADIAEGWYLQHGDQPWISQAPAHLVLGVREASYHERYQDPDKTEPDGSEIPWPVPFWWFDVGALLMLVQLAAINEGLATGFYSPADPHELAALAELVNLPEDVALAGIVTIGHPADGLAEDPDDRPTAGRLAKRRKPLSHLVRWQRW